MRENKKAKRKKVKYLKPRMRWNSGIMGYEPDVNSNVNNFLKENKINWIDISLIIIFIFILVLLILKLLKA